MIRAVYDHIQMKENKCMRIIRLDCIYSNGLDLIKRSSTLYDYSKQLHTAGHIDSFTLTYCTLTGGIVSLLVVY